MKKCFIGLIFSFLFFTGCEKVETVEYGNYVEGTYLGSAVDNYGGVENTAFAVVYVDKYGMIRSVYIDTTYVKDSINTTKKVLKDDYGMSTIMNTVEWDKQVQLLESKIIEEQGLDFINWTNDEHSLTDSVSGVTIKIDAMYKAVDDALNQAKK